MDFLKKLLNKFVEKFVEVKDEGYNDHFVWSTVDVSLKRESERYKQDSYLLHGPDYYVSPRNYDLFAVWVVLTDNKKCHCSLDLNKRILTYHKDYVNFNKFIKILRS